eukprot:2420342-Pyramimonas_sp.AAC.1
MIQSVMFFDVDNHMGELTATIQEPSFHCGHGPFVRSRHSIGEQQYAQTTITSEHCYRRRGCLRVRTELGQDTCYANQAQRVYA